MTSTLPATLDPLIQADLASVEAVLLRAVETEEWLMRHLLGLVLPGSGKRLRPILALLCGRLDRHDPEHLIPFAAALEMLHTATLVHDDIVDESPVRRGDQTLNVKVNNSIAVLVGDYMFAQSAAHTAATGNLAVISSFARTSMTIIAGQIDEAWAGGGNELAKEHYFRRIGSKTAALFALAAEGGAMLSGASESVVSALRHYGFQLGLAFQIVDDILDVTGQQQTLGKPVGSDIRQGTVTLPALLVRERVPKELFREAYLGDGHREEPIRLLLEAIRTGGGIEGSYAEAERLSEEAISALETLPAGDIREALQEFARVVVRRDA